MNNNKGTQGTAFRSMSPKQIILLLLFQYFNYFSQTVMN